MESKQLHGYLAPSLPPLTPQTIQLINYQAAQDFSKRSIPGAFIILLIFFALLYSSPIFNDAPISVSILLTIIFTSVLSRFFILKDLASHQFNTNLIRWKQIFSLAVSVSAFSWGAFAAINFYLYGLNTLVLLIFMFTVGIAGGSAISLFIWKRLAHIYLSLLLLPIYIIAITNWNSSNAIVVFAFTTYFIFLYFQINRSNREYWLALCNTELLEIQANELIASKENAEKANRAKSEFLSSMSHELRTPLNAVLGFTQLLASDTEEPLTLSQSESIHYIEDAGHHLLSLINQVLDLAKIESGTLELSIRNISLSDAVTECSPLIESSAEKKNITLSLDVKTDYTVQADPMLLKQVLINLLSNGIKYNKPNGSLTLTCQRLDHYIKVSITDTGVGIPISNQVNLFTSFSRLGHENSAIEGTGIGLAISKSLIEAMNGKLGFTSTEEEGSTFWFDLPIAD